MTNADHAVLAQQDMHTLARWWCILNNWEWPEDLPDPESREDTDGLSDRYWQIMCWIDKVVGHRTVSREWNRDMTDDEFNDFWRGTYEGDRDARIRHLHRISGDARAPRRGD